MVDQDIREDDLSDKEMSQQDVYSMYKEETMAELKQLKAQAKTVFTKTRRTLLVTIQQEKVSTCEIKEACEALDTAQEEAMEAMARLLNKYIAEKDYKSSDKISQEIEKIEIEYSDAQNWAQQSFDEASRSESYNKFVKKLEQNEEKQPSDLVKESLQKSDTKGHMELYGAVKPQSAEFSQPILTDMIDREQGLLVGDGGQKKRATDSALIGQDLWKQLKRVTIPVFSGEKKTYQNWKAAFTACVDQAPATAEYKLLQLRQCLAGEALKAIESLGHSAAAYQAAKERLERKFGGQRCQIALYLNNFRPIRPGNSKDIKRYADLLDIAIINLKESNHLEELKDGLLYMK